MRTPGMLIFGMVLSPCGWILDLTSTVAPNWREIRDIPGDSEDLILQQGIWDICRAFETSRDIECNQADVPYFDQQIIPVARGLMVASLLVTLFGLAVATGGVRCWRERPNFTIAGLGGILIFLSGVMTLIPIAWYTDILKNLTSTTAATAIDIQPGFCIILGYIGGIMQVLAGGAMVIVMCSCCGGKNRGEKPATEPPKKFTPKYPVARRLDVPSISGSKSTSSSVPYSKDSLEDVDFPFDADFPGAKPKAKPRAFGTRPTATTSSFYGDGPYDGDADL